jgi:hypothetical protein
MQLSEFEQLRQDLRDAGISLWIEDNSTLVAWPAHNLTATQRATLAANKSEIIAAHRRRMIELSPSDEACRAWRAALREHWEPRAMTTPVRIFTRHAAVDQRYMPRDEREQIANPLGVVTKNTKES